MRNNQDLEFELCKLLNGAFSDLVQGNEIAIAFGVRAKRRFGSIKITADKKVSHITINGIFKKTFIPIEIIQATIAHELCHYAHGFASPLPRKYKYPHRGGIIKKEMNQRGLAHLYDFEKKWSKANWAKVIAQEFPSTLTRPQPHPRLYRGSRQYLELSDLLRLTIRRLLTLKRNRPNK